MKFASKLAVSVVALAASSVSVHAQDAADGAADNAGAGAGAGDIVVTARRVSERLSDVPVAVTALRGDTLDSLGVRQVIDIRQAVSGLAISASAGRTSTPTYAIRGQRAADVLITQDMPITVYTDEAIISPTQGSNLGLFDLENVQVLKGPQGTLFGRNTTGGAILFTTAKPTDAFEGSVRVGYGNYDAKTATVVLNVPINDKIRLRGAADYTNTDGFGRIVAGPLAGKRTFDRDELNLRLGVAIDPTDNFKTMTTVYHSRANNGAPAFTLLDQPNERGNAGGAFGAAFWQDAYARAKARGVYDTETASTTSGSRIRITGVVHTDTLDLGDDLTFKNIFSYRRVKNSDSVDFDGTLLPVLDTHGYTSTKAYSEEAQLQGRAFEDRLTYIFGVYYYLLTGIDGTGIPGHPANVTFGIPGSVYGRVKNSSFSGFGQASYKLTDTMNVTAGLRYTVDQRRASLTNGDYPLTACTFTDDAGAPLPASACVVSNEKSFAKPSYLFTIDRKFGDTLVYLTHRYSYRAGGFNLRADTNALAEASYAPETVKDLELGVKTATDLGGIRLTANLAGYYQWYNDVQRTISVVGPTGRVGSIIQNAAKAHIYGGEAEIGLRFGRLVDLNLNYSYTKPKYDSYPTLAPVLGVPAQPEDYSDRTFAYIPRHQANANLVITPDLGDVGELRLIGNVFYQSRIYFQDDIQTRAQIIRRMLPAQSATLPQDLYLSQKGYALVNLRAELNGIAGTGLSVAAYARNVFNKRYVDSGAIFQDSIGADMGVYGAPRTYGVEATFKF